MWKNDFPVNLSTLPFVCDVVWRNVAWHGVVYDIYKRIAGQCEYEW